MRSFSGLAKKRRASRSRSASSVSGWKARCGRAGQPREAVDREVDARLVVAADDAVLEVVEVEELAAEADALEVEEARQPRIAEQEGPQHDGCLHVADALDRVVLEHGHQDGRVVGVDPVGEGILPAGKPVRVAARTDLGQAPVVAIERGSVARQPDVVHPAAHVHEAPLHGVEVVVREPGRGGRRRAGLHRGGAAQRQGDGNGNRERACDPHRSGRMPSPPRGCAGTASARRPAESDD